MHTGSRQALGVYPIVLVSECILVKLRVATRSNSRSSYVFMLNACWRCGRHISTSLKHQATPVTPFRGRGELLFCRFTTVCSRKMSESRGHRGRLHSPSRLPRSGAGGYRRARAASHNSDAAYESRDHRSEIGMAAHPSRRCARMLMRSSECDG